MSFFWIAFAIANLAALIIFVSTKVDDYLFKNYYGSDFRKYKRYKDINNTVTMVTVIFAILACSFLGSK